MIHPRRELHYSFHHVSTQQEGAAYEPVSGLSPATKSSDAFVMDFSDSRSVRNNSVVDILPSLQHFIIAVQMSKDTWVC
jgi:hypothetical protein